MNFPEIIADESVDASILQAQQKGYVVYSIASNNNGASDSEVINIAVIKKAFIITEDKDFGDEIVFKKSTHYGTLLLRLHGLHINIKISLVINIIEKYNTELLYSFSVLTSKKLRIRKTKP